MMLKAGRGKKLYAGMAHSSVFSALTEIMTLAGDPELISKSLQGIVAQTLMRKLCPNCREAYQPDAALLRRLNLPAEKIKQFYRPPTKPLVDEKGNQITCSTCKGTGYFGRVAAFEVLVLNEEIRKLVSQDAGISQIKSAYRKERGLYLQEQALRRVIEGLTSMGEVVRISKT
jgi:type II secretory ATPase GspE/PulE/Tfp pilus assembly ATPase PilB-like protein